MKLLLLATLATLGFAASIPPTTNLTTTSKVVDKKDLSPRELVLVEELEKEWEMRVFERSGLTRRNCEPSVFNSVALAGNGNPHQNFYFQQVTGNINCNGASGSVTYETSTSTSWSVSVGGAWSFLSGGFSVSESYEQGSSESMSCQATDNQICIYQKVAYTAYTVQPEICVSGCGEFACKPNGNTIVYYSPNSNQFGGCFFKGTNNRIGCANEVPGCGGLHTGFWKYCGPAGGPPNSIYCPTFATRNCNQDCLSTGP